MSKEIEVQKAVAKEVLKKLEIIDPHCILAGGAPRDWALGKPASDLDFYLHCPTHYSWGHMRNALEALGFSKTDAVGAADGEYESLTDLLYVAQFEYMGMTVQVMNMNRPTFNCVLDSFCYGTSKAWWKGRSVHVERDFIWEHSHGMFVSDKEVKHSYRKKMSDKFPSYTFARSRGIHAYPMHGSASVFMKDWAKENIVKGVSLPWDFC